MPDRDPDDLPPPQQTDVDETGVDLAQIRAMLDLQPAQRLARATEFMNALIASRNWDGTRRSN